MIVTPCLCPAPEGLAKCIALGVDGTKAYTTVAYLKGTNMAMTMLQMAGAAPTPATRADGVRLIIDAQREYTDGLLPLPGVQPAIEALAGLLDKAPTAGPPIVHVRHKSGGKAFNPSSSGYEIVAPLAPRAGETIVDKGLPNAFAGTELGKHQTAGGRRRRSSQGAAPMPSPGPSLAST